MTNKKLILGLTLMVCLGACKERVSGPKSTTALPEHPIFKPLPANASPHLKELIDGAVVQAGVTTGYDPSYVKLDYPLGDVPKETGVCSDVLVRAFRNAGVDLQKEVHEDMARAWSEYPRKWGLSSPDANIDHRRVLNLMTYFARAGKSLPVSGNQDEYLPGDVVMVGFGPWARSHWHGYELLVGIRKALPGNSQYRRRCESGRRAVCLEDHWSLPVLPVE